MDERLVKAARLGDVITLHSLMEADPEILERASINHSADSALHVAARRGKADFVKQIVPLMPSLATTTNQKGLIPLHMASAQGHVETVKELLKAKLDDEDDEVKTMNQCLVKEDDGWTPLHYAVFRGRLGVIEEFLSHCPECVEEVTAKRETVLHLAVKANQLKAVEVIAESIKWLPNFQTLLNAKDINGKTVYDLAAAKKQLQVLEGMKEDEEDDEISEEFRINMEAEGRDSEASNKEEMSNEGQLQEDAILVVATLIITLTYQALASPPSTFFKDGSTTVDWECLDLRPPFLIKRLKECPAVLAFWFMIFNTLIFFTSIFVVVITLRGPRIYVVQLLTVYLIYCYCVLLMAFCYSSVYFVFPFATLVIVGFVISRRNEALGPVIRCFGILVTKWRQKDGYHKLSTSAT